ncbi:MAG TPA: squalene/phytoene synthase family protein [Gammaproteobacteria bacterium]|nr:squalene/phytoene synthase family protein [Gammaproteobacteria bacterium]
MLEPAACAAHCRDMAAPAGSDLYYATLQLKTPRQEAVLALHALAGEIRRIPRTIADPGVARLKLAWWTDELDKLFRSGEAQHPASVVLHTAQAAPRLQPGVLHEWLQVADEEISRKTHADMQALMAACRRHEGGLWRLTAMLCGHTGEETLDAVETLGTALGLHRVLRDLRAEAGIGLLRLPLSELRRFGLADDLLRAAHEPLAELMALLAGHVRETVLNGIVALPPPDRLAQVPALIMTELCVHTLHEEQMDGFHLRERRIGLTPLRKWWIAFKVRRRERRRARHLDNR